MLLPNIYGQGALFACSGMKCPTDYNNTLVGSLLGDKLGILLYLKKRRELFFELQPPIRDINYQAVTGDVIVAELSYGNKEYRRFFRMTFLDAYTIIGETCRAAYPVMWADRGVVVNEKDSVQTFSDEKEHTVLLILEEGIDTVRFSMGYSGHSVEEAILRAQNGMQACVKTVVDQNLDFYNHISRPTNDKLFARTYAKAFSVLRTNVMSAEGKIKGYWTTPNRVPHKNMWLWDSVFHALGWQYYDVSLAYRAIEAMLEIQYEDGLIPIMATPYEALMLTQPPLLAWGIWKLYERCGDQKLINNSYEKLKKYITWNLTHRDSNKNFLFEWLISATGSGESGADNSARFDLRKTMDCVDFSSFMAKEVQTLSKMAKLLGEKDDEKYYQELFNCIQKAVNELLWDEETKTFRDRFLDGVVNKNVI